MLIITFRPFIQKGRGQKREIDALSHRNHTSGEGPGASVLGEEIHKYAVIMDRIQGFINPLYKKK
jgi:hypothetical protein